MTKALYVGVNEVAKKIKNAYIGVDGTARKITKAYVGVDNVARLFYTSSVPLFITMVQPEGGVLKATCNGVEYTESFQVESGSNISFDVQMYEGYDFGKWIITEASGDTIIMDNPFNYTISGDFSITCNLIARLPKPNEYTIAGDKSAVLVVFENDMVLNQIKSVCDTLVFYNYTDVDSGTYQGGSVVLADEEIMYHGTYPYIGISRENLVDTDYAINNNLGPEGIAPQGVGFRESSIGLFPYLSLEVSVPTTTTYGGYAFVVPPNPDDVYDDTDYIQNNLHEDLNGLEMKLIAPNIWYVYTTTPRPTYTWTENDFNNGIAWLLTFENARVAHWYLSIAGQIALIHDSANLTLTIDGFSSFNGYWYGQPYIAFSHSAYEGYIKQFYPNYSFTTKQMVPWGTAYSSGNYSGGGFSLIYGPFSGNGFSIGSTAPTLTMYNGYGYMVKSRLGIDTSINATIGYDENYGAEIALVGPNVWQIRRFTGDGNAVQSNPLPPADDYDFAGTTAACVLLWENDEVAQWYCNTYGIFWLYHSIADWVGYNITYDSLSSIRGYPMCYVSRQTYYDFVTSRGVTVTNNNVNGIVPNGVGVNSSWTVLSTINDAADSEIAIDNVYYTNPSSTGWQYTTTSYDNSYNVRIDPIAPNTFYIHRVSK